MEHNLTPVQVTVSGKDPLVVNAVAAVIGDAVSESGFTDVRVASLNREPEDRSYLKSGLSNMDVIRRTSPHLLQTPVVVEYMHHDPEDQPRDKVIDAGPLLDAHPHQSTPNDDEVIGAEVPLNPAQEDEQEFDIASELTGNVGAVDGDPVAADPEDA